MLVVLPEPSHEAGRKRRFYHDATQFVCLSLLTFRVHNPYCKYEVPASQTWTNDAEFHRNVYGLSLWTNDITVMILIMRS